MDTTPHDANTAAKSIINENNLKVELIGVKLILKKDLRRIVPDSSDDGQLGDFIRAAENFTTECPFEGQPIDALGAAIRHRDIDMRGVPTLVNHRHLAHGVGEASFFEVNRLPLLLDVDIRKRVGLS